MQLRRQLAGAAGLAALLACNDDPAGPEPRAAPVVESVGALAVPASVLGAVVHVRVQDADSVAVRHQSTAGGDNGLTPFVPVPGGMDSVAVPVLGLHPDTEYLLQVVAEGAGQDTASVLFTTGPLPDDLPQFTTTGLDPSPGFVAFASGAYGLVIDNTGRVVWYTLLPSGPSLNFQPQPAGTYVARPSASEDPALDPMIELDRFGRVIRHLGCAAGLRSRLHDARVERDGSWWTLCDEVRTMDLTAMGGQAEAQVTGTVVQHRAADGSLLFAWSAFDHLDLADLDPALRAGALVNWTHGNSLTLAGRHLFLSFRELDQVVCVDTATGAVDWRLGGTNPTLAVAGGGTPFVHQHGLRISPTGALAVLDNLGEAGSSRAEIYVVDPASGTARLTGIRTPAAPAVANIGGSTQWLPGGRLLVSYGDGGRVEEYDADGRLAWALTGDPGYVFRATRIASLYDPGGPLP